jgi:hypothetical protein
MGEHVARMGKMRDAHTLLNLDLQIKWLRRRWENNIKMDKETGYEGLI